MRGRSSKRGTARTVLGTVLTGGALLLAACGSAGGDTTVTAPTVTPSSAFHGSGTFTPPRPEPVLALTDYQGHPFDISETRGKVVFVTFLYTHCPDVCPLIASSLRAAQIQLGATASNIVLVAVSTDPTGDTPASVAAFLAARGLDGGRMRYLVGTPAQLAAVNAQWKIAAAPDAASPGAVDHTALVYGISASGRLTTLYSSNFRATDVVHDVPLLAAS